MLELEVYGLASAKVIKCFTIDENDNRDLLKILRGAQLPIASSCFGEGNCKRCVICSEILSCQVKIKDLLQISKIYDTAPLRITVDYL